jgi:hypothetical protein
MEKTNKLIAEFMGLDSFKDSLASLHQGKINIDVDVYEQAQYHTSWDWLMPVIEKCYQDYGKNAHFLQHDEHLQKSIKNREIDEVYQVLVEFIKGL